MLASFKKPPVGVNILILPLPVMIKLYLLKTGISKLLSRVICYNNGQGLLGINIFVFSLEGVYCLELEDSVYACNLDPCSAVLFIGQNVRSCASSMRRILI